MPDKTIKITRSEVGTEGLPANAYAPDIAEYLSYSSSEVAEEVVQVLGDEEAAEVFEELPLEVYKKVLLSLNHEKIARVIDAMEPDEAVDLLELLPEQDHRKILTQVESEHRGCIEALKKYHPESAGGLMTTEYLSFPADRTVAEVLPAIKSDTEAETIHVAYITGDADKLIGVVSIRDILSQNPDATLRSFMTERVISCDTGTDQEKVAQLVDKYNLSSVPVV